jgi:hypothetical protein
MKSLPFAFQALAALILLSVPAQAREEGWDHGNAGDAFASEFVLSGRDLVQRMKLLPASERQGVDLNQLAGAVLNTKVHTEERLILRGMEVDALNFPEKGLIILSRARWRPLRVASETRQRLTLVLHEYLGVMGLDDSQYRLSGRIIPQLDIKDYNPHRWWNPLNPANRVSLELAYAPEGCTIDGFNFDPALPSETLTIQTVGPCGDAYRTVIVRKNSYTAPPGSPARGTFHRYEIQVLSAAGDPLGQMTYEPEWSSCLLPQDGVCRLSGKIFVGGVELIFWMQR